MTTRSPVPLEGYLHPSESAYSAGCGCNPCRMRRSRVEKRRKAYGVDMMPTDAMRAWVIRLVSEGFVTEQIARAAGVDPKTVWNLQFTDQQRIHGKLGRSLLVVTRPAIIACAEDGEEVPSLGATRRLHALMRMGWSIRGLGSTYAETQSLARISSGRNWRLKARTYRWVTEVYDHHSMTPGPSDSSRIRAEKKGLAPPMAWDDETIDDPAALPNFGDPYPERRALHAQGLSDGDIGRQLGVSRDTIRMWRIGAGLPANYQRNGRVA